MASSASRLSFDSDPIRLLFPHTTHHHHHKTYTLLMDKVNNGPPSSSPPPPTTIQCHDLPNGSQINEMDFFANKKHQEDHSMLPLSISNPPHTEFDCNINTGLHLVTGNTSSDQSVVEDGFSPNSEDKQAKTELAMVRAELERMNMENKKLREVLNQVTLSYNALQTHVVMMMQQKQKAEHQKPYSSEDCNKTSKDDGGGGGGDQLMAVPRPFMDLGLAAVAEADENSNSQSSSEGRSHEEQIREDSPNQQPLVVETDSNKTPRLGSKTNTNSTSIDQATEETIRKARVSVRARSEAPMIADGCQWRKYGQKMAKGNPCPRAYYRCTMAAGCPVRKQVQRCAEDRTILVTTYEGTHSHPLPPTAMAMASTTSSAARMLLSGSMPSSDGIMNNSNFLPRTFLSCSSSMATISGSAPFPTVSLDLTQTPSPLQMQRAGQGQFLVPFSNFGQQNFIAGPNAALLPQIFGQALYNQSKFSGLQMSNDNETCMSTQLGLPSLHHQGVSPGALADTVTALTADPNFSAALAAAITSVFGGGSQPDNNNPGGNANNGNVTNNNNGSATTTNNNSHGNNKVNNSIN